ncbi:MAG: putative quorum-sensing-regulated virulence factor [Parachlamydiaceae bacterium]
MRSLDKEVFICLDCETTGLDTVADRIIEVAVVKFDFSTFLEQYETLIDPEYPISETSIAIHHITPDMVAGKPRIQAVLPSLLEIIGNHIIVGHGIQFDIDLLANAADRAGIPHTLKHNRTLDTLRLARLYGESPTNSLEQLRQHFNIPHEGAHRAMNDVIVNIEVFKYLARRYKSTHQLFDVLSRPIQMKTMPLGPHKGRPMKEIPIEYLRWAVHKDFDQDLIYSIRLELKRRKSGNQFSQSANPFANL